MPEQQLASYARKVETDIKIALIKRSMTQRELAGLIGTGTQQLSRAIKGDMSPRSQEIRKQVERVLDL